MIRSFMQKNLIYQINLLSVKIVVLNHNKSNYKDYSYYDLIIVILYAKTQIFLCKLLLSTIFVNSISYKATLKFIFNFYIKAFIKKKFINHIKLFFINIVLYIFFDYTIKSMVLFNICVLVSKFFVLRYKESSYKLFLYKYKTKWETYTDAMVKRCMRYV